MSNALQVHFVTKGDTRTPFFSVLSQSGMPVDLAALTVKFAMVTSAGVAKVADGTSNVTAHPTFSFTADADADTIKRDGNLAKDGDQIIVATSGTLPTGLTASTRYFVRERTPNTFKLSLTPGGPLIDITAAGSGTHTYYIVGSVQYAWQAANVDTAGDFYPHWRVLNGSAIDTFPHDQSVADPKLIIRIMEGVI